jgi:hypothetical protein
MAFCDSFLAAQKNQWLLPQSQSPIGDHDGHRYEFRSLTGRSVPCGNLA